MSECVKHIKKLI